MSKIVSITKLRTEAEKARNKKMIDVKASCVLIEECLLYLNMNDLEELKNVKSEMEDVLKKLKKMDR